MGSEVTNAPSSSIDESSDLKRDLWGPRLYVKNKESQESKTTTNSKEFDVKECNNPSLAEVNPQGQTEFVSHEQEVASNIVSEPRESLITERRKQNEHEKLSSPTESPSKPTKFRIERLCRTFSQPLANEKRVSNGKNVAKTRPSNTVRKSLLPENITHSDNDDGCSSAFSSRASTKSPNFQPTVAIAPSFTCEERAAKRKEFYAKLEERRKALEAEKLEAEARAREEKEAALKQLRKNLYIKAKPVPSFYKEGPPPKVELKKIPPTRAKSPKLSRRRSLDDATNKHSNGICYRLTRHSLDSKKGIDHKLYNATKSGITYSSNKDGRKLTENSKKGDIDAISEVSQEISQTDLNSEKANFSMDEVSKFEQGENDAESEVSQ